MPPGEQATVWSVVQQLNRAWLTGDLAGMPALLHERAVIADANHQRLCVGREACVESYRQFVSAAKVEAYTEAEPAIELFGAAAVVVYPFTIRYELNGRSCAESGSDCLVLERGGAAGWVVIWRQLVWRPT